VVCSNSLFPKRKLLEDSFDEREGTSPNWNPAEAGVSASIPEDAGPRLQNESLASD
jgi:hypothetical protein